MGRFDNLPKLIDPFNLKEGDTVERRERGVVVDIRRNIGEIVIKNESDGKFVLLAERGRYYLVSRPDPDIALRGSIADKLAEVFPDTTIPFSVVEEVIKEVREFDG
jgi:hypothetical protein